ncbi:hypothetical protein F5Y17DRAFT_422915 [Xylariaceae sp. FL0594]|nr:hypothetical protein F5Y17DRAFT_422915 [Xylariaceae sp. FL0594]
MQTFLSLSLIIHALIIWGLRLHGYYLALPDLTDTEVTYGGVGVGIGDVIDRALQVSLSTISKEVTDTLSAPTRYTISLTLGSSSPL